MNSVNKFMEGSRINERSLSATAAAFSHSTSSEEQKTYVSILFPSRSPATLAPLSEAHKAIVVGLLECLRGKGDQSQSPASTTTIIIITKLSLLTCRACQLRNLLSK